MKNSKPQPRHSGLDPESRKPTEARLDTGLRRYDEGHRFIWVHPDSQNRHDTEASSFICVHPRSSAAN